MKKIFLLIQQHNHHFLYKRERSVIRMAAIQIEQVLSQIGNFGFPLVLAIYLLLRFEKKIEKLTEVISHLDNSIKK